jgi:hypothetical protein
MSRSADWAGKRVNNLTVIGRGPKNKGSNGRPALWVCMCDCGKKRLASSTELRRGLAKTCGDRRCPYRRQVRSRAPIAKGEPIPLSMFEMDALMSSPCALCGTIDREFGLMVLKNPKRKFGRDNVLMMCRKCRGLYAYARGLSHRPSFEKLVAHLRAIVKYMYLNGIELTPVLDEPTSNTPPEL